MKGYRILLYPMKILGLHILGYTCYSKVSLFVSLLIEYANGFEIVILFYKLSPTHCRRRRLSTDEIHQKLLLESS